MLTAIARKKLSHNKILEDALTSSVFSRIGQFSPATAWHIASQLLVRELFSESEILQSVKTKSPTNSEIEFWPRLRALDDRIAEPDVIITFTFEDQTSIAIVVEVKWKAPLSEKQLSRQRDAFITTRGRSSSVFQVLIVKDISDAINAEASQSDNPESLRIHTWQEIYQNLFRIEASSPSDETLKYWLDELKSAFQTIYPPPFNGFFNTRKPSTSKWNYMEFRFRNLKKPTVMKWKINQ